MAKKKAKKVVRKKGLSIGTLSNMCRLSLGRVRNDITKLYVISIIAVVLSIVSIVLVVLK